MGEWNLENTKSHVLTILVTVDFERRIYKEIHFHNDGEGNFVSQFARNTLSKILDILADLLFSL